MNHADPYRAPEPPAPEPPAGSAEAEEEAPAPAEQNGSEDLARAEAERDQYLDALQRLKAEFDNYRKRTERDREAVVTGAQRELVRGLLPVMDNLERAVAALGERGDEIVAGLEMVRGQLAGLLAGHGVEEIEADGRLFDPNVHEAVAQLPSADHPEGAVVEVIEKGYRISDHVLRPSRVVVAATPPPAAGEGDAGAAA
ncbi:MAG TPA: nucleotide exchange factor GrpE [Miltoncostaeaceae bacterium]|nr:nucleotide exchange factor GrpE [Miltoncostaeaceae bacterium]